MARIKCINPKCTSPDGTFILNEQDYLEKNGRFVNPGTRDARDIMVKCPACGADNIVWAIGLNTVTVDRIARGEVLRGEL
jgi:hypothetical protein